jgi:hypothetical protein
MRMAFGVFHAHELGIDNALQLRDHALPRCAPRKSHVVRTFGEHGLEDVLHTSASASVALSARFANAISGLDHPELRKMPAGVRILGTESGAEV